MNSKQLRDIKYKFKIILIRKDAKDFSMITLAKKIKHMTSRWTADFYETSFQMRRRMGEKKLKSTKESK